MKPLLTFICICTLATSSLAQLRYQFYPGREVAMTQAIDLTILQNIDGMEMSMKTRISTDIQFKIIEVNGNTAKMEGMYKFMGMDLAIDMMGMDSKFNVSSSKEPEVPEMMESHRIFKSMVDVPFFIFLNKNGSVEKTEGLEVLADKMREVTTDEQAIQDMEKNFRPEKLRSDYARMFAFYPAKTMKEGTQWNDKVTLEDMGIIDVDQTWTVDFINHSTDQMEISSKVENLRMQKDEDDVSVDLSGFMTTHFMIDILTGWPQHMELVSEMKGVASGNGELEGMTWPMEMKMTSTTNYEVQE